MRKREGITSQVAWAILLSNRQRERARTLRRLALLEKPTRSQKHAFNSLLEEVERMEKAGSPSPTAERREPSV